MTTQVERMPADGSLYYREHMARYEFAMRQARPGVTLDIATGTGYGAAYVAQYLGTPCIGVDVDHSAIAGARLTYSSHNLTYIVADGCNLPFADQYFENIVTLETLEHIADANRFLSELRRTLKPDGVVVLSTPNKLYSVAHKITNPFHVCEYTEADLLTLLRGFFKQVDLFYQGFAPTYQARVREHKQNVANGRDSLPLPVKLAIRHVYRPIRRWIPRSMTNYAIKNTLNLTYPQPEPLEIVVSDEPIEDFNVFVTVCRQPLGEADKHA